MLRLLRRLWKRWNARVWASDIISILLVWLKRNVVSLACWASATKSESASVQRDHKLKCSKIVMVILIRCLRTERFTATRVDLTRQHTQYKDIGHMDGWIVVRGCLLYFRRLCTNSAYLAYEECKFCVQLRLWKSVYRNQLNLIDFF